MATDPKSETTLTDETSQFKGTQFLGITTKKHPSRICFRLKSGQQFIFPQYEFVSARLDVKAHEELLFLEYRTYLVLLKGRRLDHLARTIAIDEVFAINEVSPSPMEEDLCYVLEIEVGEKSEGDEEGE